MRKARPFAVLALFTLIGSARAHDEHLPIVTAPAGGQVVYFPKEAQFLLGVRTEQLAVRTLETRLTVPGKIVPRTDRFAALFPPVAGRVLAPPSGLPLVGARVRKGQVLALVRQSLSAADSAQLAEGRIKADSALAAARATLDQARRDLERVQGLGGAVAEKEVQRAQLTVKLAEQDVERAQRERSLFSDSPSTHTGRLAEYPIAAPLDGVLVQAHATVGEQVDTGKVLFTVLDPRVVWVEAAVFADDVARVEAARSATLHAEAYESERFDATLFNLGQIVDEQTRTVKVIFEVKNDAGRLRPGQFVDVSIGAGGKQDVLAVPDAAVVEVEGRRLVYVHAAPEEFVAREVVLGAREDGWWAVKRGLSVGERVVTVGTYQLRSAH
jgi:cobalt-zinc-cadmium efflux system membrane fusion protein